MEHMIYKPSKHMPKIVHDLFEKYSRRGRFLGAGRNRVVFQVNPKWVVKIPRNSAGFTDNDWEGSVSNSPESTEDDIQYARTIMVYLEGCPLLFMEYVTQAEVKYEELPDWVGFVDCGQVGYNASGKLVAYDYGIR